MEHDIKVDAEETRAALLDKAQKLAGSACKHYELHGADVAFIGFSECATYRIRTAGEDKHLLRIHLDRRSKAEIQSELFFLEALQGVDSGVPDRNGETVIELRTDDGNSSSYITLMNWIDGQPAAEGITDQQVYNVGQLLQRLHQAVEGIVLPPGFIRPRWGARSFDEAMTRLARYYSSFLTEPEWRLYGHAAAKIRTALAGMKRNAHTYGLIHADLHIGNIVFDEDDPRPIDFGRCGFGYFLYDAAAILLALGPEQRRNMLRAYHGTRQMREDEVKQLECFFYHDHDGELQPPCFQSAGMGRSAG
ncbi:phosphotransferase enzyme family protein [Paenibacillus ihbetae]|uniref:phosphotransferase enzyme family protein n=1 Tax=Paenibacillus ihbetae TaxID=1870820 RepID=UPI0012FFEF5D|nr:phosphotransferase [Paenibacillus ihbetae]